MLTALPYSLALLSLAAGTYLAFIGAIDAKWGDRPPEQPTAQRRAWHIFKMYLGVGLLIYGLVRSGTLLADRVRGVSESNITPVDVSIHISWGTLALVAGMLLSIYIPFCIVGLIYCVRQERGYHRQMAHHIRDTRGAQLREITSAFDEAAANSPQDSLYNTPEHSANKEYDFAMMCAYNAQQGLDNVMEEHLERHPERIDTENYANAVDYATRSWNTLKHEAEKAESSQPALTGTETAERTSQE